ncbi:MAG: bacillithiol biosynthesis cysteine-adding enzyme BshC [Ignavibacteriaceae bacterium]|nr:bacillithiol biosynthesis cysteine-adding enzyme BshC [Ignavibacteriaceae bacterium]
MFVKFDELNQFPSIVRDFFYDFNKVKKYYHLNFRDTDHYTQFFKQLIDKKNERFSRLAEIIRNQYSSQTVSEKTSKSLSLLDHENTLFIVTGQQLGIFSGPLYTLYKAITAIKLAEKLNQEYVNINFIPVFWLEGDDHDFDEVRKCTIIADDNSQKRIYYDDGLPEETDRGYVGEIKFNENISLTINDIRNSLRNTEYTNDILELLSSFYSPNKTFKESFRNVIRILFDEYGLIIFDPQDDAVKKLLKPVFKNEIENFRPHTEQLIRISAELEEAYHAQAKVRPVNLFIKHENGRFAIEPLEDGGFRLKRKKVKYSKEELLNFCEETPEAFSPNVMLRPVCQDYLFKTAFYVAGPGEISYFAQAFTLYGFFDINRPILYPRASVTLVEKNIQTVLQKYSLEYTEVFKEPEKIVEKVLRERSLQDLESVFGDTFNSVEQSLGALKSYVNEVDRGTAESVEKFRLRFDQFLEDLKRKTIDAEKMKNETITRQIQKLLMSLLPFNELQEREINYFYFANKYGPGLIHRIYNEVDTHQFEHQVIEL